MTNVECASYKLCFELVIQDFSENRKKICLCKIELSSHVAFIILLISVNGCFNIYQMVTSCSQVNPDSPQVIWRLQTALNRRVYSHSEHALHHIQTQLANPKPTQPASLLLPIETIKKHLPTLGLPSSATYRPQCFP